MYIRGVAVIKSRRQGLLIVRVTALLVELALFSLGPGAAAAAGGGGVFIFIGVFVVFVARSCDHLDR